MEMNENKKTVTREQEKLKNSVESSKAIDSGLIEASKNVDKDLAGIGLIIAELFKTVSLAAVRFPNLELHSDLIDVVVDENTILVRIVGLSGDKEDAPDHCHSKAGKLG